MLDTIDARGRAGNPAGRVSRNRRSGSNRQGCKREIMNRNQRIIQIGFFVAIFTIVVFRNTLGLSRTGGTICIVILAIIAMVLQRLAKDPKHPDAN
jgi:hypothetical protein